MTNGKRSPVVAHAPQRCHPCREPLVVVVQLDGPMNPATALCRTHLTTAVRLGKVELCEDCFPGGIEGALAPA